MIGVVSLRDLMGMARIRPRDGEQDRRAARARRRRGGRNDGGRCPGQEGFFHYRQYSAVDLAQQRSLEDVWHLLFEGELPDAAASAAFARRCGLAADLPPGLAALLPALAAQGAPLEVLRSAVSVLGAELGWRPTHDIDADELYDQALGLCAVVPTILATAHRLREGLDPVEPRGGPGLRRQLPVHATGEMPSAAHARAIEQYMILTIDHGFNASTFTARVITSTGADLGAAIVGAIGALPGPSTAARRAGPSTCSTPSARRTGPRPTSAGPSRTASGSWASATASTRPTTRARCCCVGWPNAWVDRWSPSPQDVERTTVDVLAELKPGRQLYTNVEFYAGVVMHTCGIPREMFTPTFAAGRTIGWSTHVMEQASHNRLIRPAARYVGPPPPQPVPPASLGEPRTPDEPLAGRRLNMTNMLCNRRKP